jgi:hypothetical protein
MIKFTYDLETGEEDGWGGLDERSSNNQQSSHTLWRRMKTMGWDDQMRGIQKKTKFTYILETGEGEGMKGL